MYIAFSKIPIHICLYSKFLKIIGHSYNIKMRSKNCISVHSTLLPLHIIFNYVVNNMQRFIFYHITYHLLLVQLINYYIKDHRNDFHTTKKLHD
jgi:hypothetical protein